MELTADALAVDVLSKISSKLKPIKGKIPERLGLRRAVERRKGAEGPVGSRRDCYDSLADSIHDGLMVIERDHTVSYANDALARQMGMKKEDIIGRPCFRVRHHSERRCAVDGCPLDELYRTKRPQMVLHKHMSGDGGFRWVEVSLSPVFDEAGEVVRVVEVLRDVTERKRSEEALEVAHEKLKRAYQALERAQSAAVATEKLAALGRLTAGISHEILNPLNIMTLRLSLMIDRPGMPEPVVAELRGLEEQANRIAKIAQDLLFFSRQSPPERRLLDLNETVRRTVGLLGHDLRLQEVALELELAEELPSILADQDQLRQVVFNLVSNARDVMPEGGRLTLRTSAISNNGSPCVELRVADTGGGIPSEDVCKVFDPFFTTKPEGAGSGLGLSICQGIVEAHGGAIWAENAPGQGATFVVRLGLDGG